MKKAFFLIFQVLFITAIVSSCNKDKEPTEKFSKATVEENKAVVEDAGIELVTTMKDMKTMQTVDAVANLGDILSSSSDEKKSILSKDSKLISTLETFTAAASGEKKLNDLFKVMLSPRELSDDPESIKEFWDENVGTYTWNPGLVDWDIELGGNKVIVLFPSSNVAITNDATLTVSNYTGINISNPIDEDYTGDLPVSLNADIKVGSTTLVTMTFAASYNSDGVPKAVASDLTIEGYKFEVDLSNETNLASVNYKFSKGTSVIMDLGASGKGLFTEANYNSNTRTVTETYEYPIDWVYNPNTGTYDPIYTDEWEETDFEEILNSADAHFQLFDIAIRGDVNVKGLMDQMNIIEADRDNEVITRETAAAKEAENINKFMNLRLVNVKSNEILAKTEAYVVKEVNYDYEDIYVDLRLTFNDGSPVDMETYFDQGFDDFVSELNGLIRDINSDYDYLGIEEIEY